LGIPKRTLIVLAVLVGVVVLYQIGKDEQGNGDTGQGGTESAVTAPQCKVLVVADILNVRSQPDPNAPKVGSFKKDAQLAAETVVENGFRKLGGDRWVAEEFVRPVEGTRCS